MRLPRVRFTVRRMMAAIAGLAALIGGGITEARRRAAYTERLNYHFQQLEGAGGPYSMFHRLPRPNQESLIRAWVYHAMMWQKYEDALAIPLRYVDPDPPEPR